MAHPIGGKLLLWKMLQKKVAVFFVVGLRKKPFSTAALVSNVKAYLSLSRCGGGAIRVRTKGGGSSCGRVSASNGEFTL